MVEKNIVECMLRVNYRSVIGDGKIVVEFAIVNLQRLTSSMKWVEYVIACSTFFARFWVT